MCETQTSHPRLCVSGSVAVSLRATQTRAMHFSDCDTPWRVTNESTRAFLTNFLTEYREHVLRVITVLPRQA